MTDQLATLPAVYAALEWQPVPQRIAAVSWWGADNDHWVAPLPDGGRALAKRPRKHFGDWIDPTAPAAARRVASDCGVGPELLAVDSTGAITVERLLEEPWRVGTLTRLTSPDPLLALAHSRERFRSATTAEGLRTIALPDEIRSLVHELPGRMPVAEGLGALARLDAIAEAVAGGPEPRPGWGSSESSDSLVRGNEARLVGGGRAGIMDPLADVGALLTEVSPYLLDSEVAFRLLWHDDHPGALARARLYGVLADLHALLWAYHAALWDSTSDANHTGYAIRRVWRLRAVSDGELDALVDAAKGGWS